MLAVSPLMTTKDGEMDSFPMGCNDDFPDFTGGNLLDSIDFDDLFVGIHDGDLLPDLEMDPEILAEFSISAGEESDTATNNNNNSTNATATSVLSAEDKTSSSSSKQEAGSSNSGSDLGSGLTSLNQGGEEILSKRDENTNPSPKENNNYDKGKKSSAQSKNNNPQGKRKVKVDWTPELHRRFVQAVEQLGVDKAVPSRILELMGIDCLTRHNIASHLQKYRSHRKHLLAREAEAANWSQRRQMYGGGGGGGGGGGKREMSPWVAPPTMGFPPPMPHFRPLHVWGHPSVDQSLMPHMWQPKHHHHLAPSTSPPPAAPAPAWTPPPPPPPLTDPSFWHSHHQRVPTPCFPAPIAPARFPAPPVPGIPPPPMYKLDPGMGVPTTPTPAAQPLPRPDFHPSKESIDAAIGDVISKPWLPLPLGLKPPSMDTVMVELQRQGVSKVPPASCAT